MDMITRLFQNKNINQAITLYLTMILGVMLGFAVSLINTRLLDVDSYGKFKFIQQLFTFLGTVMVFGFSYSSGRLVALDENQDKKNGLISATILTGFFLVFLTVLIVLGLCFFADDLFNTSISEYLIWCAPFAFVPIFTLILENLFQGLNEINKLSFLRIGPRFFYVITSLLFVLFFKLSLPSALAIHWGAGTLLILFFLCRFKFTLFGISNSFQEILIENKTNGFPVYIGSLAAVASGQAIGIFLGYHADMATVGFYSLGLIVTMPLQLIPSVLGTTLFKSFANSTHIPQKIIYITLGISIFLLIVYWLLIEKILLFAYTKEYAAVSSYAKILSVGMVFHGLGNLYNRFLGAHGKGKNLRNASFLTGAVILIGCFAAIPYYGAMAAAFVKSLSSLTYCLMMFIYYKLFQYKVV